MNPRQKKPPAAPVTPMQRYIRQIKARLKAMEHKLEQIQRLHDESTKALRIRIEVKKELLAKLEA